MLGLPPFLEFTNKYLSLSTMIKESRNCKMSHVNCMHKYKRTS